MLQHAMQHRGASQEIGFRILSAFHFLIGVPRCLDVLRHAMRQGALSCCRKAQEMRFCVPLSAYWKCYATPCKAARGKAHSEFRSLCIGRRYATPCNALPGIAPRRPAVLWCNSISKILDSARIEQRLQTRCDRQNVCELRK